MSWHVSKNVIGSLLFKVWLFRYSCSYYVAEGFMGLRSLCRVWLFRYSCSFYVVEGFMGLCLLFRVWLF